MNFLIFQFANIWIPTKNGLENDKWVFHKEKLNTIDIVYKKHILSFLTKVSGSRPVFCEKLTLRNLKVPAKLANLTLSQ